MGDNGKGVGEEEYGVWLRWSWVSAKGRRDERTVLIFSVFFFSISPGT